MENKKIKGIFDKQRVDLPDDFWNKLEPNIPEYREKRKRFFGFSLFGCLGFSILMVALCAIGYNALKLDEITNSLSSTSKSERPKDEIINNESTNNATNTTNTIDNTEREVIENDFKKNSAKLIKDYPNVRSKPLNSILNTEESKSVYRPDENKVKINNLTPSKAVKGNSTFQNGSISQDSVFASTRSIENDIDEPSNVALKVDGKRIITGDISLNQHLIYIEKVRLLIPFLFKERSTYSIKLSSIKESKDIDNSLKNKHFLEGGYNSVFAIRTIQSDSENVWQINKTKYERNYISHEGYLNYGRYLNRHIYLSSGLRYTMIQELFDYQYDTTSTTNFTFRKGKRILEHTNKLNLVDVSMSVGFEHLWKKVNFGGSIGASYNLLFTQKGLGINNNNVLSKIEDAEIYSTNTGLALHVNFSLGYYIHPRLELKINSGVRSYLSDFASDRSDFPLSFNYKSFNNGLSMRYFF